MSHILTQEQKKIIINTIENEIDHLEDELNFHIGEIIDQLNLKLTIEARLEAMILARAIFFEN